MKREIRAAHSRAEQSRAGERGRHYSSLPLDRRSESHGHHRLLPPPIFIVFQRGRADRGNIERNTMREGIRGVGGESGSTDRTVHNFPDSSARSPGQLSCDAIMGHVGSKSAETCQVAPTWTSHRQPIAPVGRNGAEDSHDEAALTAPRVTTTAAIPHRFRTTSPL